MLYFSFFHLQCPPCRGFTPKLIDTYKALQQQEKNFEIVFLSSDRSEEAFNEYFKEMPWLAAPYGHSSSKELSGLFSVQGEMGKVK